MTKQEWLQICRLNQEWYYRKVLFDNKTLSEADDKWIKEHMPADDIFDDGRIEFFQTHFKPEINEEKLDELANKYANEKWLTEWPHIPYESGIEESDVIKDFKAGYRKAMGE